MDISYFKAIQNATGLRHKKEVDVEEYKRRFAHDFDTSIGAVYSTTRNDNPQDFIIVPTEAGCKIWTRPGETVDIGDIIFYNSLHWLVTDINFHDELHRCATMVRCNRQIRWQNQTTGEIVERWCLVTKPYTSNIDKGVSISMSNREYKIQIPYDSETRLIDLDRRFLLEEIGGEPKAYEVSSVDTLTNRYQDIEGGFLIWNVTQGTYNPEVDNAELMIANYFVPGDTPQPPVTNALRCEISGSKTIPSGMRRSYTAKFYALDETTIDDNILAAWEVATPIALEGHVEQTVNGNTLSLRIVGDDSVVGEIITISLTDSNGLYNKTSLEVEVSSLL